MKMEDTKPLKIVKNVKIAKLSRERSTVRGALQRGLDDSYKNGWKRVLIIGQTHDGRVSLHHTEEADEILLGLLDKGKLAIYKEYL